MSELSFFVIASGLSLTADDCARVRDWRNADRQVIVVNRSWKMAPWADILFAGDAQFWAYDPYRIEIEKEFAGRKFTASPKAAKLYGLELMPFPILSNSGANAIKLASSLGGKSIYLLGFDWGGPHWHEDHPEPLTNGREFETPEITLLSHRLRDAGVSVINCTRKTGLTCFPIMDLELTT